MVLEGGLRLGAQGAERLQRRQAGFAPTGLDRPLLDQVERAQLPEVGDHQLGGSDRQEHARALAVVIHVHRHAGIASPEAPGQAIGGVGRAAEGAEEEQAGAMPRAIRAPEGERAVGGAGELPAVDEDVRLPIVRQPRRQRPKLAQIAPIRHRPAPSVKPIVSGPPRKSQRGLYVEGRITAA